MKRKEKGSKTGASASAETQKGKTVTEASKSEKDQDGEELFLFDNGKLKPFRAEDYTASTLYQKMESFSVECKLVRPDDPANLVYEGRKPSKKTVPIIVTKSEDCRLLESWEQLESDPEQLAEAVEVIGAIPVKQVFVLRRN